MDLGAGDLREYWELQRLRRRRTGRLVVSGFVCAFFVAGTAWSLLSPDYVVAQGSGKLARGHAGLRRLAFAYSRTLSRQRSASDLQNDFVGALRGGRRRAAARLRLHRCATGDRCRPHRTFQATRGPADGGRRVWAICAVPAPLGVMLFHAENTAAGELLAHGTRVPGVVVSVRQHVKGGVSRVV